jgi:hypothetical protein
MASCRRLSNRHVGQDGILRRIGNPPIPFGRTNSMARKTRVWLLFLFVLFLLSLATTPYSKTVDAILICLRLTLVAIMSILTLREWLKSQRTGSEWETQTRPKAGDSLLRRLRRWYFDEHK